MPTASRNAEAVLQMLLQDPDLVSSEMVENFQRYKRLEGSTDAMTHIASSTFPDGEQQHDLLGGAGHLPQLEASEEVNALIEAHTQQVA